MTGKKIVNVLRRRSGDDASVICPWIGEDTTQKNLIDRERRIGRDIRRVCTPRRQFTLRRTDKQRRDRNLLVQERERQAKATENRYETR